MQLQLHVPRASFRACVQECAMPGCDAAHMNKLPGQHQRVCPCRFTGLKLGSPFILDYLWSMLLFGSHHLCSQAGWNRCRYKSILTSIQLTCIRPCGLYQVLWQLALSRLSSIWSSKGRGVDRTWALRWLGQSTLLSTMVPGRHCLKLSSPSSCGASRTWIGQGHTAGS